MSDTRVLLLTDIVDSTRLTQALGDAAATALWATHDRVARDLLVRFRGREIDKSDGMLLLFEAATDALDYALAYHAALAALTVPLRSRAGLHVGPVVLRHNPPADVARGAKPLEVDGLAKPMAARVMALAGGGQTLLSAAARAALGDTAALLHSCGHWLVKGVDEPIELFAAGADDAALAPLSDSDKAYRVVRIGERWLPVSRVPHNLPQPAGSFIGRGALITEVNAALEHGRLVTLTGAGGSGKTRLAQQVAAERLPAYPNGVWQVELAALNDVALVAQAVAGALGVKEEPGRPITTTLVESLRSQRLLLLLDNAEHLVAACARLADAVVSRCLQVSVLTTSREPLGLPGEAVLRVPSLALPRPSASTPDEVARADAVRLLVERTRLHTPQFEVDAGNAAGLAAICRHLDGIPLAIELAAARLRTLSVDEVVVRLDQRFRLLTGGARTAVPRQQTLRALIDWSHDLLSPAEKTLLRRLSVFAGGWVLAAAEAVCSIPDVDRDQVLDLLTTLADKSLVQVEQRDQAPRFRLLETMRQYARERLLECDEAASLRARHLACCLDLVERAEAQLSGAEQGLWLDRLEAEHDNLLAALDFAAGAGGDAVSGLRLAGALAPFWSTRGYPSEGRRWLTLLLERAADAPDAVRAKALGGAARLVREQADYELSNTLLAQELQLRQQMGDRRGLAAAWHQLGMLARERGDYHRAGELLHQGLAAARELGDRALIAVLLNGLGNLARESGDPGEARSYFEQGLALDRELGHRLAIAISLNNLGGLAYDRCDFEAARALHEESLAIRRELGERKGIASSLTHLGAVMTVLGELDAGQRLLEESLVMRRELGDRRGAAIALTELGHVSTYRGDLASAQALHRESLSIRRELGDRWGIAASLNCLGQVATRGADWSLAQACFFESLGLLRVMGDRWGIAEALHGLGDVATGCGAAERAVCLWSASGKLRTELDAPLVPSEQRLYESRLSAARAAIGDAAYARAWQAGAGMTLEQMLDQAVREAPAPTSAAAGSAPG